MARRIAVISDVHGNLPALEAVLADARAAGAEAVWDLGDFVGHGPFPDECVAALRQAAAVNIRGNYDRKVLAFPRKRAEWATTKRPEKFRTFQWTHARLSPASRKYLARLRGQVRRREQGLRVLLVHGSPAADDEPLGHGTPMRRLAELADQSDADLILCGHTHEPWVASAGATWFLNPGGVGMCSSAVERRPSYALVDFEAGRFETEFRRVNYDADDVLRAMREAGLPEGSARGMAEGRGPGGQTTEEATEGCEPPLVKAAVELARQCRWDERHARQDARLATELYDRLSPVHGLDEYRRLLLECGALLHDIGWLHGQKGHHKAAMRMILDDDALPLEDRHRQVVAMIARFHRKAVPTADSPELVGLDRRDRRPAMLLAGMLRLADGLDAAHDCAVRGLTCRFSPGRVTVVCAGLAPGGPDALGAAKKSGLLAQALGMEVAIAPADAPEPSGTA